MKKKILKVLSLVLVCTMAAASLTGCGTQAKATDDEVVDGETIIVTEEETEDEAIIEEEEITETEVIEETAFTGAEDENIVLYAEMGEQEYLPMSEHEFTERFATVTATEDIPIYNGGGCNIGYIKADASVLTTECAKDVAWSRFENPISGTEYDYIYVNNEYVVVDESTVSAERMKQIIIDELNQMFAVSTIIDSPTSDMEVYEFIISNKNDKSAISFRLQETVFEDSDAYKYTTFAVECEEDTDGEAYIHCKVYFKDLYDDVVAQ